MEEAFPLARLSPGEHGRVWKLNAQGPIRRRLQDLGLVPGAVMECVAQSPLGTPSAYRIRGAVIALRKKDAQSVLVTW